MDFRTCSKNHPLGNPAQRKYHVDVNHLIESLRNQLPADVLLTGAEVGDRHASDWSGSHSRLPEVLFRPETTAQVSRILKQCNDARQPLVLQGGLTGLSGGATPGRGEWALSLDRMTGIVELDVDALTVTVRAGTPLQTIQQAAAEQDLMLPLDLGARGSCQIGGNVATNAGGNQVIQYGMARNLVLGLEAVLADGTVIPAHNKLLKNNAGYDLKHLFIGSEGTLGVITEVVLRLYPRTRTRQSALCGLSSYDHVVRLLNRMRTVLPSVSAFEVMWRSYYGYCTETVDAARDPFDKTHPFYVLLESDGRDPGRDADRFQQALFDEMEAGLIADCVVAQSHKEREGFWEIRDGIGEILSRFRHTANFDIGIPIGDTGRFVEQMEARLKERQPDIPPLVFGHLGDGNLHVVADSGTPERQADIEDTVYGLVREYRACITAEHGVGKHKKPWLDCSRSAEELALMKMLKRSMDPNGILNPGRIFDL